MASTNSPYISLMKTSLGKWLGYQSLKECFTFFVSTPPTIFFNSVQVWYTTHHIFSFCVSTLPVTEWPCVLLQYVDVIYSVASISHPVALHPCNSLQCILSVPFSHLYKTREGSHPRTRGLSAAGPDMSHCDGIRLWPPFTTQPAVLGICIHQYEHHPSLVLLPLIPPPTFFQPPWLDHAPFTHHVPPSITVLW